MSQDQIIMNEFELLQHIVNQSLEINSKIEYELELLKEAPSFIVSAFLKAYQAIHVLGEKPTHVNECDSEIAFKLGLTTKEPSASFHYPVSPSALPDYDIDFADNHKVMDYAVQKYGSDNVCKIGTVGKFRFKSLLKSLTTIFIDDDGERLISPKEINEFTKKIGIKFEYGSKENEEDEEENDDVFETSNEHILEFQKQYPYLFDHLIKLLDLPRYSGCHAGGILILPKPFKEIFPIKKVKDTENTYATEFSEGQGTNEIGSLGGIKIDLLGLMTLPILEVANDLVVRRYNLNANSPSPCSCLKENIPCETNYLLPMYTRYSITLGRQVELIDLDKLCLNIKEVFQTVCDGKTEGIFQFEPRGITDFAKSYAPSEFKDFPLITSLYRPGAMDCHLDKNGMPIDKDTRPLDYERARGAHISFVERRHGRERVIIPAPQLNDVLGATNGVIVYQEQNSQVIMKMTGCSFADAEKIRKYFTKVKPELLRTDPDTIAKVSAMEKKFIEDVVAFGGTSEQGLDVWNMILPFARYGFNYSHAVSYSLLSYQTAFFRALYPLEFIVGLLTFHDKEEKILSYIRTAQKLNLVVKKPNINTSQALFTIDDDNAILSGLTLVKGVGNKAAVHIINNRIEEGPFTSIDDFLSRKIQWKTVNIRILESLACAGAFDDICPNRRFAYAKIRIAKGKEKKTDYQTESLDIFEEDDEDGTTTKNNRKNTEIVVEDWSFAEKLNKEREVFGFPFDDTLRKNITQIKKYYTIFQQITQKNGKEATFGIIESIYLKPDKTGADMAFITVSDLEGNKSKWTMFSSIYGQFSQKVLKNEPCFAFGKNDLKYNSFLVEGLDTVHNFVDTFTKFKSTKT